MNKVAVRDLLALSHVNELLGLAKQIIVCPTLHPSKHQQQRARRLGHGVIDGHDAVGGEVADQALQPQDRGVVESA